MMGQDMRAMHPATVVDWAAMSVSVVVGFVVAYPVNVWLVAVGLKHGMGTERALGKGGHGMDLEDVWEDMVRTGRRAAGDLAEKVGKAAGA